MITFHNCSCFLPVIFSTTKLIRFRRCQNGKKLQIRKWKQNHFYIQNLFACCRNHSSFFHCKTIFGVSNVLYTSLGDQIWKLFWFLKSSLADPHKVVTINRRHLQTKKWLLVFQIH